jgi:hypothetical protein
MLSLDRFRIGACSVVVHHDIGGLAGSSFPCSIRKESYVLLIPSENRVSHRERHVKLRFLGLVTGLVTVNGTRSTL